ncbi:MAG: WG repeat-containing protein, partial [Bacteroidaceae bacterium]|nr:WG repeat-containing protein [Bacteroidaceae bacterium]
INTKGEEVIPCIYDLVDDLSEGLALVKQNDKYSVVNTEGKVIVAECDNGLTSWSRVEME